MPRVFKDHGALNATAVPFSEQKLFREIEKPVFDEEKMKKIVAIAEGELETPIPLCPASLYIQYVENGNRSNYEAVYFRRRQLAFDFALAEFYERKGRFTMKLLDAVWAILEESSWTIPAHLGSNSPSHGNFKLPAVWDDSRLHAIDLFSAATGGVLAAIYILAKDILDGVTPVVCEKIKTLVLDRQIKPFLNCNFWWTGAFGNTVNNWNPWINSNFLFMTAVFVEDEYRRTLLLRKIMGYVDNFTKDYAPDGGCDEGPNYWTVAGASYFDDLELVYDLTGGAVNVYDDPLVKAMFEYEAKMHIHGDRFINFADCPPHSRPSGAMLRRMGEKCGSELLIRFGETMTAYNGVDRNTSCPYRALRSLLMKDVSSNVDVGATKVWFPYLKVMAAREDPDTGKGLFVAMKGGCNGESHNHNDVGNVVVFYNGNPVIIDTGCGTYTKKTFSSQRYELWYMQSHFHNLADVGGFAELDGRQFASSDEVYDEATGGVKMELKNAFPKEAGILSYQRACVLAGGEIRITDSFDLDTEKEVDIHFLTCQAPALNGGEISLVEGRTLVFDPALKPEIEEFPIEDGGLEGAWKSKVLWKIHLKANVKKGSFVTVIR